jgi:hypothetical protein
MSVVNIRIWWDFHEESHGGGYCSGEEIDPNLTVDYTASAVVQVPVSQYRAGRRGGICLTQFGSHNKTWSCKAERVWGGSGYCSGGRGSWKRVTRAEFVSEADAELVRHVKFRRAV